MTSRQGQKEQLRQTPNTLVRAASSNFQKLSIEGSSSERTIKVLYLKAHGKGYKKRNFQKLVLTIGNGFIPRYGGLAEYLTVLLTATNCDPSKANLLAFGESGPSWRCLGPIQLYHERQCRWLFLSGLASSLNLSCNKAKLLLFVSLAVVWAQTLLNRLYWRYWSSQVVATGKGRVRPESVHYCLFQPYTRLIIVSRLLPPHSLPHVTRLPLFFPSYSHTSSKSSHGSVWLPCLGFPSAPCEPRTSHL